MTLFLDAAFIPGGLGVFLSVALILGAFAIAFIAFKLLKKSLRMAFRVIIVVIILAVAIAGSVALWAVSGGKPTKPTPTNRTR